MPKHPTDTVVKKPPTPTKSHPTFIFITSCASTRTVPPRARVQDLPTGLTMTQAIDEWMDLLDKNGPPSLTPGELYRGLGFHTLAKIQEDYQPTGVKIVTGGQGLIDINEKIVPYDFTASPKEAHNIHQKVTKEPFVQTTWWKMINEARNKTAAPIKNIVEFTASDMVLISCSKIFLRYISDDILSVSPKDWGRIRILLSASSVGSVPMQLRRFIVPFGRETVAHMPGNRNDGNHRAAQFFLERWLHDETGEFRNAEPAVQARMMKPESSSTNPYKYTAAMDAKKLEEILKQRPELLHMDADTAYKLIRRDHGTIGGRMYFRGIHRKLAPPALNTTKGEVTSAASLIKGMSFASATSQAVSTEDEVLRVVKVFTEGLKEANLASVAFTSANVCEWAEKWAVETGEGIPADFGQPNKLTYIIKNNLELLNLREVSFDGGRGFSLVPTPAREVYEDPKLVRRSVTPKK